MLESILAICATFYTMNGCHQFFEGQVEFVIYSMSCVYFRCLARTKSMKR